MADHLTPDLIAESAAAGRKYEPCTGLEVRYRTGRLRQNPGRSFKSDTKTVVISRSGRRKAGPRLRWPPRSRGLRRALPLLDSLGV